jgi:hypothetical protein
MERHAPKLEQLPVKDVYDSHIFRKNEDAIRRKVVELNESFFADKTFHLGMMFDIRATLAGRRDINQDLVQSRSYEKIFPTPLTDEEMADIENFVMYATSRIVAGAAYSKKFHELAQQGEVQKPFQTFLPDKYTVGHDAIHAMMAYLRTNGSSLRPAYTQAEVLTSKAGHSNDFAANLEEKYVLMFSQEPVFERIYGRLELVLLQGNATIDEAVEDFFQEFESSLAYSGRTSIEYAKENRLPAMVEVIRNLATQIKEGSVDPNFRVHEFQRLLRPLLDRLKEKTYF